MNETGLNPDFHGSSFTGAFLLDTMLMIVLRRRQS